LPLSPTNRRSEEHALREAMRVVEHADVLLRRMVLSLSRLPAEHNLERAARDEKRSLKPHLEEAMEALEEIERCRGLTNQELALRRAFRMLLVSPD
jgi:hypothetical protein